MNEQQDIRWLQRLDSYKKALKTLSSDIELATERELSNIEQRGLIQAFEYTYELAWKVIKDFYQSMGDTEIQGSKDAFKMAFQRGLVFNNSLMQTVKSHQLTSHTYNEKTASEICHDVIDNYYEIFQELMDNLQSQKEKRGY